MKSAFQRGDAIICKVVVFLMMVAVLYFSTMVIIGYAILGAVWLWDHHRWMFWTITVIIMYAPLATLLGWLVGRFIKSNDMWEYK